MKQTIIIRSLRVALVLAILSVSMNLTIFYSWGFVILLLVSMFFLDTTDSMLVWRLKRIEDSKMGNSFIYVYLAVTAVTFCLCAYALVNRSNLETKNLYTMMWIFYSFMLMIFSFRYFIITVRVMTKFLDAD